MKQNKEETKIEDDKNNMRRTYITFSLLALFLTSYFKNVIPSVLTETLMWVAFLNSLGALIVYKQLIKSEKDLKNKEVKQEEVKVEE